MEKKSVKGETWIKLTSKERELVKKELRVLNAAGGDTEWTQFTKLLDQVAKKD